MIKKIEHTAIMVKNMEESIEFYTDVFGFTVRLRGKRGDRELAFLYKDGYPDTEIELICDQSPEEPFNENSIVNHLAFTVDDIEAAIEYLREKNVDLSPEAIRPTLEGGKMIMFYGPNREYLQLVERVKE